MNTKSILLFITATYFCCAISCKQKPGSAEKDGQKEAVENLAAATLVSNDESDDSSIFTVDKDMLDATMSSIIERSDYNKYKLSQFFPKPDLSHATFLIYEESFNFSFLNSGIEIRLIAQRGDIDRAWLVGYDANGNLISNYLVFCDGEKLEHIDNHQIYTKFNAEDFFVVHDNDVFFFDEKETPIKIYADGRFEAYPEEEFSQDKYGFGWGSEGLYGKYPLREDWTIIDKEGKRVINVKMAQHATDELNGVVTLFDEAFGKYSNIGVQGTFSSSDISYHSPDSISLLENKGIKQLVESARDEISKENFEARGYTVSKLYQLSVDNDIYYLAICSIDYSTDSYQDIQNFLVGVFNGKVYRLTRVCFYEEYNALNVFSIKGRTYLYANNTSCGEGAGLSEYLYLLDKGFSEEYSLFTSGD